MAQQLPSNRAVLPDNLAAAKEIPVFYSGDRQFNAARNFVDNFPQSSQARAYTIEDTKWGKFVLTGDAQTEIAEATQALQAYAKDKLGGITVTVH